MYASAFPEHLLAKGKFPYFQGECFAQLSKLMLNKRENGLPARSEKEFFNQLLSLAGLFSAPASKYSTLGLGQNAKIFLPSFHSGARFLAVAFVKYFNLKMTCNAARASCCSKSADETNNYTCSECCIFHAKSCKTLFAQFK